jgi:hypothetical protein
VALYPECLTRATTRVSRRSATDLEIIRRATTRVEELGAILDRQVRDEPRSEERLRHLRHATGQITRVANDAVQAHRRVAAALRDEAERPGADVEEIERTAVRLAEARDAMLKALDAASRRYPWADPWRGGEDAADTIG